MMRLDRAIVVAAWLALIPLGAGAQSDRSDAPPRERASETESPVEREHPARVESAQNRCRANRGVDCDSREGLREWVQQERPISDRERAAAAGARRHREACSKSKSGC